MGKRIASGSALGAALRESVSSGEMIGGLGSRLCERPRQCSEAAADWPRPARRWPPVFI